MLKTNMLSLQKTKATHPSFQDWRILLIVFVCFILFSGVHQINHWDHSREHVWKKSYSKHLGHCQARDRSTAIREVENDTGEANLSPQCCDYIWDLCSVIIQSRLASLLKSGALVCS